MSQPDDATPHSIERLRDDARAVLDKFLPEDLRHFVDLVPDGPASREIAPSHLPVLKWLDDLAAGASFRTRPVVEGVIALAPRMAWGQTYDKAEVPDGFLERYGWSEIVGPRGPIACQGFAMGVLMFGPSVNYPNHAHDAEEVYLPLSGTSLWQRDNADFAPLRPGAVIHHPPQMPHAMRTLSGPMLALYLWRGNDLSEKSTFR